MLFNVLQKRVLLVLLLNVSFTSIHTMEMYATLELYNQKTEQLADKIAESKVVTKLEMLSFCKTLSTLRNATKVDQAFLTNNLIDATKITDSQSALNQLKIGFIETWKFDNCHRLNETTSALQSILFDKSGRFVGINTRVQQTQASWLVAEYIQYTYQELPAQAYLKQLSEQNDMQFGMRPPSVQKRANHRDRIIANSFNNQLLELLYFCENEQIEDASQYIYQNVMAKQRASSIEEYIDYSRDSADLFKYFHEYCGVEKNKAGFKYKYMLDPFMRAQMQNQQALTSEDKIYLKRLLSARFDIVENILINSRIAKDNYLAHSIAYDLLEYINDPNKAYNFLKNLENFNQTQKIASRLRKNVLESCHYSSFTASGNFQTKELEKTVCYNEYFVQRSNLAEKSQQELHELDSITLRELQFPSPQAVIGVKTLEYENGQQNIIDCDFSSPFNAIINSITQTQSTRSGYPSSYKQYEIDSNFSRHKNRVLEDQAKYWTPHLQVQLEELQKIEKEVQAQTAYLIQVNGGLSHHCGGEAEELRLRNTLLKPEHTALRNNIAGEPYFYVHERYGGIMLEWPETAHKVLALYDKTEKHSNFKNYVKKFKANGESAHRRITDLAWDYQQSFEKKASLLLGNDTTYKNWKKEQWREAAIGYYKDKSKIDYIINKNPFGLNAIEKAHFLLTRALPQECIIDEKAAQLLDKFAVNKYDFFKKLENGSSLALHKNIIEVLSKTADFVAQSNRSAENTDAVAKSVIQVAQKANDLNRNGQSEAAKKLIYYGQRGIDCALLLGYGVVKGAIGVFDPRAWKQLGVQLGEFSLFAVQYFLENAQALDLHDRAMELKFFENVVSYGLNTSQETKEFLEEFTQFADDYSEQVDAKHTAIKEAFKKKLIESVKDLSPEAAAEMVGELIGSTIGFKGLLYGCKVLGSAAKQVELGCTLSAALGRINKPQLLIASLEDLGMPTAHLEYFETIAVTVAQETVVATGQAKRAATAAAKCKIGAKLGTIAEVEACAAESRDIMHAMFKEVELTHKVTLAKETKDAVHLTFCNDLFKARKHLIEVVELQKRYNNVFPHNPAVLEGKMINVDLEHILFLNPEIKNGSIVRVSGGHGYFVEQGHARLFNIRRNEKLGNEAMNLALGNVVKGPLHTKFPHQNLERLLLDIINAAKNPTGVITKKGGWKTFIGKTDCGDKIKIMIQEVTGNTRAYPV